MTTWTENVLDGEGNIIGTVERYVPDETTRQEEITAALDTAIAFFGGNYRNWGSMTNAQKDAANRQAQRALANIARLIRGRFDSAD